MIGISQLLQVLQGAESAHPQPGGAAVKPSQGGFAKLFGAFLEQARAAPGELVALPAGSAVVQAESGTEVQESGEVEGGDGLAPDFVVRDDDSHALSKFDTELVERLDRRLAVRGIVMLPGHGSTHTDHVVGFLVEFLGAHQEVYG